MGRKTIVVSGGTRGIGKAIVQKFYSEGFVTAVCARSSTDLSRLKEELISGSEDQRFLGFECDMADRAQIDRFAMEVKNNVENVDVLVNNAGIFLPGQISTEEEGTFEKLWQVNVGGAYHLTRALLPLIRPKKNAHIFNMCSTASITAYVNGGSYCITKHALLGMNRVLREELKQDGIKVTAILPGATLTDSWRGTELPEDRFIPAQDIAEIVWNCYNTDASTVVEELLVRPQLGDIT